MSEQMSLFTILDGEKTFNAVCDSLGCENNTPAWPDNFGESVKNGYLKTTFQRFEL